VSAGWNSVPLRELCEFHNGLWTGKKGPFSTATVIRNTNFTPDGRIDLSDVAILQVEARQLAKRSLRKADIIIEKSGGGPKQPVGRVVLFELDAANYSFSNFTSVIRVKNPETIDPTYLHRVLYWWYVSGLTEPLQRRSTGIRNLDFDAYKSLEVPVPPLDEQRRIVAVLDQAFAALDCARARVAANLADANELFRRTLSAAFDEENGLEVEMRSLFEIGSSKRVLKAQWVTQGVPFYRGREVTALSREGSVDNQLFITEEHFAELEERYGVPTAGDIIITAIGTIGNAYIVQDRDRFYFKDASVLWMKKSRDVSSEYVLAWLRSPRFFEQLDTGNGATVDTLTIQKMQSIKIPLPASDQQERTVTTLDAMRVQVEKLRSTYERQLADIAALRQSVLHTAFSGQLT